MIAIVSVRQTADKPNFPLRPLPVFRGSSMTLGIVDVPPTRESIAVTGVSLAVENAVGAVVSASAVESGGVWTATIPASHFAAVGVVAMGVTINASGTDENGAARSWIIGKGDLTILPADGVPVPGETLQNVHLRDSVPQTPIKGDLCEGANGWQIYTGEEWAVISPDLSNYATKADATLTPVFDPDPTKAKWVCSPAQMTGEEPYSVAWREVGMNAWNWVLSGGDGSQSLPQEAGDSNAGEVTFWIPSYGIGQMEVEYVTATRVPVGYQLGDQSTRKLATAAQGALALTAVQPSALPSSETWTFEVDDGQGGTTTVTKNVAIYAGANA